MRQDLFEMSVVLVITLCIVGLVLLGFFIHGLRGTL